MRTARTDGLALLLLFSGLVLDLATGPQDPWKARAEALLSSPLERIALPGLPAYRSERGEAVLFFEGEGARGRIVGAAVVEGDRLKHIHVLKAREGIEGESMKNPALLEAYRGQSTTRPLDVDVLTAATISSRGLADAVNERCSEWRRYRDSERERPESHETPDS